MADSATPLDILFLLRTNGAEHIFVIVAALPSGLAIASPAQAATWAALENSWPFTLSDEPHRFGRPDYLDWQRLPDRYAATVHWQPTRWSHNTRSGSIG